MNRVEITLSAASFSLLHCRCCLATVILPLSSRCRCLTAVVLPLLSRHRRLNAVVVDVDVASYLINTTVLK